MTPNTYQFDMDLLKEPCQEFAWLFARMVGQDNIAYLPWYAKFVLYFTFRMGLYFD